MKPWTVLLAAVLAFGALDAEAARRLGGGSSTGRQPPPAAQRQDAPAAKPAAPTQVAQQQPADAATAAPNRPRAAGMLGGLAAGLGLAWLAGALGLGEAFGQFMLFALAAFILLVVTGLVLRARRGGAPARTGYALQGAGAPVRPVAPPSYSPDKVGNDASARPWERSSMAFDAAQAGAAHPAARITEPAGAALPPDFDAEAFVAAAKRNFIALQDAWDRSDTARLRGMMTDGMLGQIQGELAARDREPQGAPAHTEVLLLRAHLLGVEEAGGHYLASVEFSGMIREDLSAGPSPFREVWNLTRPRDASAGWLVAGVQALQ